MFSVRIDKNDEAEGGYIFKVAPMENGPELIALDSTPGIIAFVEAANPGEAAQRAWDKGFRELFAARRLPVPNLELDE
jgi:hypothetical protein